jgi:hypothetical protein
MSALTGIIRATEPLRLDEPLDLDLVEIKVGGEYEGTNALWLGPNATGVIHRLDIYTDAGDALKIDGAHDLMILGGRLRGEVIFPGHHKDGIQVLRGTNVLMHGLNVCVNASNAQLYISNKGTDYPPPENVVFEWGVLRPFDPLAWHNVSVNVSEQCGVRYSAIFESAGQGLTFDVEGASEPVDVGNIYLPYSGAPELPPPC